MSTFFLRKVIFSSSSVFHVCVMSFNQLEFSMLWLVSTVDIDVIILFFISTAISKISWTILLKKKTSATHSSPNLRLFEAEKYQYLRQWLIFENREKSHLPFQFVSMKTFRWILIWQTFETAGRLIRNTFTKTKKKQLTECIESVISFLWQADWFCTSIDHSSLSKTCFSYWKFMWNLHPLIEIAIKTLNCCKS